MMRRCRYMRIVRGICICKRRDCECGDSCSSLISYIVSLVGRLASGPLQVVGIILPLAITKVTCQAAWATRCRGPYIQTASQIL
jgi:hypothetical protein